MTKEEEKLIKECYNKAIEVLYGNVSKYGLLASGFSIKAKKRNYISIFARDACISVFGLVLSGNKSLIDAAQRSLITLAKYQAENGEIPNFVRPNDNYIDFWRLGSIDATLWWLIALDFFDKRYKAKKLRLKLKVNIEKALTWLSCHEHQDDFLLVQPEAADWADIMPRSGRVLYTNALWCQVKKIYNLAQAKKTKENFVYFFNPFFAQKNRKWPRSEENTSKAILEHHRPRPYYFSFISFLYWGNDIDVYGNSLAIIFNLVEKNRAQKIIKYFLQKPRVANMPLPILFRPIKKNSFLWRRYMLNHNLNLPYQYHNGGVWPYAAAFWSIALKRAGQSQEAKKELLRIAKLNKRNNWQFNEWFHALSGRPMGMPKQSWNAAMYISAYYFLKNKKVF